MANIIAGQAFDASVSVKNPNSVKATVRLEGEILTSAGQSIGWMYNKPVGGTPSQPSIGDAVRYVTADFGPGQTKVLTMYSPPIGATGYLNVHWTASIGGKKSEKVDTNKVYVEPQGGTTTPPPGWTPNLPMIYTGCAGPYVEFLQQRLHDFGFDPGPVDGIFGPLTEDAVRRFQTAKKIAVDGIVGPETWSYLLVTPPEFPNLQMGDQGPYVSFVQQRLLEIGLSHTVNGVFDNMTHDALIEFQNMRGLSATGVVDQVTWQALFR